GKGKVQQVHIPGVIIRCVRAAEQKNVPGAGSGGDRNTPYILRADLRPDNLIPALPIAVPAPLRRNRRPAERLSIGTLEREVLAVRGRPGLKCGAAARLVLDDA